MEEVNNINFSLILQKTDRILAGDTDIVVNESTKNHFAFCDAQGRKIYLDFHKIENLIKDIDLVSYLILTKGLNYHELAHVMFTNYNTEEIKNYLLSSIRKYPRIQLDCGPNAQNKWRNILSILEDCRIENVFYHMFPRARYYFEFCAINIIESKVRNKLAMGEDWKNYKSNLCTYMLLYGRKFLPIDVKVKLKNKLLQNDKYKNMIPQIEVLIDKFIQEKELVKRFDLCTELSIILAAEDVVGTSSQDSLQRGSKTSKTNERTLRDAIDKIKEKIKEQKKEEEKINENEDADDVEESEEESSKDLEDEEGDEVEGENKDNQNSESEVKESNENGDSDSDDGENNKDSEEESNQSGDKSSKQDDISEGETTEEIIDTMKEKLKEELENNEGLNQEIENDIAALTRNDNNDSEYSGEQLTKTMDLLVQTKKLEIVLKELRGDLRSSVRRNKTRGKIDMHSAMKAQKRHTLKIFSKKTLNSIDKARLGVSLILDSSGSISDPQFRQELKASYSLSQALENLDNKIEIIEFNTTFRMLKKFNSEGDWKRGVSGNTALTAPFQKAIVDLKNLRKTDNINNLFIIIVSDGEFNEQPLEVAKLVEEAHNNNIKVMWILVKGSCGYMAERMKKNFDWFIHIDDFTELSNKLSTVIKDIQKHVNENIKLITGGN